MAELKKKRRRNMANRTRRMQRSKEAKVNRAAIKGWLITNHIRMKDIAEEAGVTEGTFSLYLSREFGSEKLTQCLVSKGCPADHFEDNMVKAS